MAGKYHAYSKYKDSSVEWLGDIPAHWDVTRIKHIVSTPVTDGPHETPDFIDSGIPFISAEAVSSGNINFNKIRAHISKEDNERYSIKYSPKLHDIYMVKSGATTGVTAIVETSCPFNIWSPLAAIRCNETSSPYFVLNFLRSNNFQEAVELNWSFGTQQNIGMGVIENLCVTRPPLEEAKIISDFLIHETAKINGLIEKQQLLIKLLKEKRQAVISHAVTKGLNPSALMKDSGVEWLGNIPEHWKLRPLKSMVKIKNGSDYKNVEAENGYPVLGSGGQFTFASKFMYDKKSVLLGRKGTIDKPLYIEEPFWTVDTMYYTEVNSDIDVRYLYYLALTIQFNRYATNTALPSMTQENLGNFTFSVPSSKQDRQEIATFLDKETTKIDELVLKSEQTIVLTRERRAALISAAVTGKIDVRNWQVLEQNKNNKEQVA